jgi:hypothetical protein
LYKIARLVADSATSGCSYPSCFSRSRSSNSNGRGSSSGSEMDSVHSGAFM